MTTINGFSAGADEGIDPRLLPLLESDAQAGSRMRRPGALFDGSSESALRQLGRSTHLFAETTQQNPSFTGREPLGVAGRFAGRRVPQHHSEYLAQRPHPGHG